MGHVQSLRFDWFVVLFGGGLVRSPTVSRAKVLIPKKATQVRREEKDQPLPFEVCSVPLIREPLPLRRNGLRQLFRFPGSRHTQYRFSRGAQGFIWTQNPGRLIELTGSTTV